MRLVTIFLGLIALLAIISVPTSYSAVPLQMNYQGSITDSTGNPINDTLDITFRIYIDSITTSAEWIEIHNSVPIEVEIIELKLASITPFPVDLFDNDELWLGITVGPDPEISPRTQLLTVPYSIVTRTVSGDIFTAPGSLFIPNLTNTDTLISFTPGSVTFQGVPVDFDGTEASWIGSGHDYVRIDSAGLDLSSPDATPIPGTELPTSDPPFISLSDDLLGQLFYSIIQSGELKTGCVECSTKASLTPDQLIFTSSGNSDTNLIIGNAGLDLRGGTLDLSGSSLTVGGSLTVDGGGTFGNGDTLSFTGPDSSTLKLSSKGVISDFGSVTVTGSGTITRSSELTATDLFINNADSLTIRVSGDRVTFDDGAQTPVVIGSGGSSGGFVDLSGGAGGGSVRITADSLSSLSGSGDIRAIGGRLMIEPSGGGAGGRIILTGDKSIYTDDVAIDSVTIHRTDGLIAVAGASGTVAVYTAAGVQITGPTAKKFAANPTNISLTRPSTNTAWAVDLNDASDLMYCDLDDDGIRDISCQYTPSKELRLESGTGFVCIGPTSLTTCDVSGAATYASSVDISGTMTCNGPSIYNGSCTYNETVIYAKPVSFSDTVKITNSTISGDLTVESSGSVTITGSTVTGDLKCEKTTIFDPNNDAIDDISVTAAPTPTLSLAAGTDLDCLGPSFFSSPVTVTSDLTVTGIKAFVQDHPEDNTKEIVYVALEGNEAGTYSRGSGQLIDGVAEILLPEDFRLVTNEEGLTAQITPRGPVQAMLYVESVTPTLLIVKSSSENDKNVKFDFMINGVRAGFEDHQVIRDKKSYAINNK